MTLSLSVVVPSRDTRELTLACLASLAAAGGDGPAAIEVILIDDGSGDDTAAAVAARHPEVRVLRNDTAAGFTVSANRGLAAARADLLLLLNSDTEVEAGGLAALLAAFAARPGLGVAGAHLLYPDGRAQWSGGREPGLLWAFALASGLPALLGRLPGYRRLKPPGATWEAGPEAAPVPVDWVTGAALALRREVWETVGPLDDRFRLYGQDLDLCLRTGDAGWEVALLPGFRVLHHQGATVRRQRPDAAVQAQDPGLLWSDLVRWAAKRRGRRGGRRTATALAWGARLRLGARVLATPIFPAERRRAWRAESRALRRALTDLGRESPP